MYPDSLNPFPNQSVTVRHSSHCNWSWVVSSFQEVVLYAKYIPSLHTRNPVSTASGPSTAEQLMSTTPHTLSGWAMANLAEYRINTSHTVELALLHDNVGPCPIPQGNHCLHLQLVQHHHQVHPQLLQQQIWNVNHLTISISIPAWKERRSLLEVPLLQEPGHRCKGGGIWT